MTIFGNVVINEKVELQYIGGTCEVILLSICQKVLKMIKNKGSENNLKKSEDLLRKTWQKMKKWNYNY